MYYKLEKVGKMGEWRCVGFRLDRSARGTHRIPKFTRHREEEEEERASCPEWTKCARARRRHKQDAFTIQSRDVVVEGDSREGPRDEKLLPQHRSAKR